MDQGHFQSTFGNSDETDRKLPFDSSRFLLRFSGKNGTTVDGSSMATSEESIGGEIP
jgi:hypothetical protein